LVTESESDFPLATSIVLSTTHICYRTTTCSLLIVIFWNPKENTQKKFLQAKPKQKQNETKKTEAKPEATSKCQSKKQHRYEQNLSSNLL
jgi:hypothetical protein